MPADPDAEIFRLRRALRDLVALSAIPAAWVGREPQAIAAGLADVLAGSLYLDFAFVRLCNPEGGTEVEVTRGGAWKAFPEWLQNHLTIAGQFSRRVIIPDLGGGAEPYRGILIPIGVNAEGGLVAAACARADFPDEIDQLLLSVAANQAVTAFHSASLADQLRKARDGLETKVVERTADLQRSETYLAEAQRLSHTGSWAWTPSTGEITYWSEECFRVLGFEPAGRQPRFEEFSQRIHPEDQAEFVERLQGNVRERLAFETDFRIVHPGGAVRDIHGLGHPVFSPSGDLVEFIGTMIDITERKRADEALRRQANLLEQTHDAILAWEFPGKIIYWNRGAEQLYGFSREVAIGRRSHDLLRTEHSMPAEVFEPLIERQGTWNGELTQTTRDGRKILVESRHVLMREADGRRLVLETNRDITERKRAEEAVRQAQADLAHISRVTTMGELTASLAHELNQPIAAAVTNAQTCLRFLTRDQPDLEEARDAASRIVGDATRAAGIISRIRLPFKRSAPQREWVDVNDVIREMIVLLHNEANRYSILIRTELSRDLPNVMADRVELQQVLMNLVLNGIEAMKDMSPAGELDIRSRAEDGQVLISVSDSGVGLPPQVDQIFSAFFTTKPGGLGMGLAISRSIIESHGGRLWATANSGRGATFHFTLPSNAEAS